MRRNSFDIGIIGGGINGTGIAADAAKRGLKVLLLEQNDLASGTSSVSSKLIHGGLRYLEQHEFKLVREALSEREILLTNAKHLVKPLSFILPHHKKLRSRFTIRIGLFLYDHLAKRSKLQNSYTVILKNHPAGTLLKPDFTHAFQYADCCVDDARLVIANALEAKKHSAVILTYSPLISAERANDHWLLNVKDKVKGKEFTEKVRVLINAAGPWVEDVLHKAKIKSNYQMALVKGSHIIVPKLYDENFAFIFQHTDNRVVFIIPYLNHFSLIGTTDSQFTDTPDKVHISQDEIDYLLQAVNEYLLRPLTKNDILHTYSGIRPLLQNYADNPAEITRDYVIDMNTLDNFPPLLSIFGGKLTTYRRLAEKTIDLLKPFFPSIQASTTSATTLPGSDFSNSQLLWLQVKGKYSHLPSELLMRYIAQYGTNIYCLLENCVSLKDLGKHFGADIYQKEVDYLVSTEWANTSEDILWRRTKQGYFFPKENIPALTEYIKIKLTCFNEEIKNKSILQ